MEKKLLEILQRKNNLAKTGGLFLILLIFLTIILSLNMGKAHISVTDILQIIVAKVGGSGVLPEGITLGQEAILWDIRLPRILAALLVGSGLAVSGAVFQSLLMNPLADSYTMGVSTGAAFGAVLGIYINLMSNSIKLPITICAFSGAFVTLLLVVSIAKVRGYLDSSNLVIAGIIVSSILSAAISIIKSASGEQVAAIIYWLMGSLVARSWEQIFFAFPLIVGSIFLCIYYGEDLNIMCLGDQEARILGIEVEKVRIIFLIAGSLITAVCVSISGIIGFIGLIVPHMLRFIIGSDNRLLIPLSALCGGELLLLADTGARALMNVEVPVGVITTLLGGPFFIYIFITRNKTLHQ